MITVKSKKKGGNGPTLVYMPININMDDNIQ